MIFKEKVKTIVDTCLAQYPELFLIDLSITDTNKISITIDGDKGVILQNCIQVSRDVEEQLDRETEDFSIDVSSSGVSSPLKLTRQYIKNIGRTLQVKTASETIEGKLVFADQEEIQLEWTSREPKKIGKGKETVKNERKISYQDIKEAIVIITF